jgi:hypothetical protein
MIPCVRSNNGALEFTAHNQTHRKFWYWIFTFLVSCYSYFWFWINAVPIACKSLSFFILKFLCLRNGIFAILVLPWEKIILSELIG